MARAVESARALRAAPAGLERRVQVNLHRAEGRRDSENDAGENRDAEGKRQHRAVDMDLVEARDVARVDGAHDAEGPGRDGEAERAASHAEQNAFGEELPHHA